MNRRIVAYGPGSDQDAELFTPNGAGPFRVVVVLHGGFWRARWTRELMDDVCADLAARGYAAWNVEYRRVGPTSGGGWPATFVDVAVAIDSLADVEAPLDVGHIAALGHSAGGHLALWAASRTGLPADAPGAAPKVPVTAAVAQAGALDLREAFRLGLSSGAAAELLGGSPRRHPDRYDLASPLERLPLGIPQLLVHGEADDTVPASMSRSYHTAAVRAGDDVELAVMPGVGHFDHLDPGSHAWHVAIDWLARR